MISLLVSFTLTPMLASKLIGKAAGTGRRGEGSTASRLGYGGCGWSLAHRGVMVAGALLTVGSLFSSPRQGAGASGRPEKFPGGHPGA
jgi:multidrug efflux pump subunit AcrB